MLAQGGTPATPASPAHVFNQHARRHGYANGSCHATTGHAVEHRLARGSRAPGRGAVDRRHRDEHRRELRGRRHQPRPHRYRMATARSASRPGLQPRRGRALPSRRPVAPIAGCVGPTVGAVAPGSDHRGSCERSTSRASHPASVRVSANHHLRQWAADAGRLDEHRARTPSSSRTGMLDGRGHPRSNIPI